MSPRPPKTAAFFAAHSVFTRKEFADAMKHSSAAATVASLLGHHLRTGHIKRVSREVFSTVPAHIPAERWVFDRFTAASKLREDGVLGYHSALELHGIAHAEFSEVQVISAGRPGSLGLPTGPCRFLRPATALIRQGKFNYQTVTMDRLGVTIRLTGVERTVVDVLRRPEISGGVDEVMQSLDLVQYLDPGKVVDYAVLLGNRTLAAIAGWWLERRRTVVEVPEKLLARLHALLPRSKHYCLGAKPGDAVLNEHWRVLLPKRIAASTFEGS